MFLERVDFIHKKPFYFHKDATIYYIQNIDYQYLAIKYLKITHKGDQIGLFSFVRSIEILHCQTKPLAPHPIPFDFCNNTKHFCCK